MSQLTFFCTSSPFLLSQIPLGSFVPRKEQPHQNVRVPYRVKPEDFTVRADEAYHAADSSSSGNLFRVLATKFASVSHAQSKSAGLKVLVVKGGNLDTLDNPDSLFEEIVFGEEHGKKIRAWFEHCREWGSNPRFVVGLRTFVDDNDAIRWETQEVETTDGDMVQFAFPSVEADGRGSGSGPGSSDEELTDWDDEA